MLSITAVDFTQNEVLTQIGEDVYSASKVLASTEGKLDLAVRMVVKGCFDRFYVVP